MLHTDKLDGTQDESPALVSGAGVSAPALDAAAAATGVPVVALTDEDLAPDVNLVSPPQELEGLEGEASVPAAAADVRPVRVIYGTPARGQPGVRQLSYAFGWPTGCAKEERHDKWVIAQRRFSLCFQVLSCRAL